MLHSLNEDTTLYYLGGNNKIYEWNITVSDNSIIISHGTHNGQKVTTYEDIEKGKGGRSLFGQIQSRVRSRINTQKLKGYKETIEEAQQGRTNALDLPKPMLAQSWQKVKNINLDDAYVQWKYDGNRCLIVRQGGETFAYSRKGKIITSIPHILRDIDIPEGTILDGELYSHNTPLSTIRSWIARKQPDTLKLQYHAYDIVLPVKYQYRFKMLKELSLTGSASVAPTWLWSDLAASNSLSDLMAKALEQNYEGLILRTNDRGYEVGKRSKSLLKVKSFLDKEFVAFELYLSEKGMPMAKCLTTEGKEFGVVLPGSKEEKHYALTNKHTYEGQTLTVEFSQWTPDGIPFHAVAKNWRDI